MGFVTASQRRPGGGKEIIVVLFDVIVPGVRLQQPLGTGTLDDNI